MIRPRGGTTRRRDDEQEQAISSIEEIGRQLRGAREDRGLDLLAVHDRLSRPITQIEALEHGDVGSLPDQALAISTLRRYATFLGLDGDALALQMLDAWSVVVQASSGRASAPVTSVVAAVSTGPDHLRAFTQTGKVPKVAGRSTSAAGGSAAYDYGVATGPPTGTFPVVPRRELRQSKRAVARARRQLRAPTSVKVVTWAAVLFLLAALVGLGIDQTRPQWLAEAHLLRVVPPGTVSAGPRTAPNAPTGSTPGASSHQPVVAAGITTPNSTAYTVHRPSFVLRVGTTGPCWLLITSSTSSIPLATGVQPAGKQLAFPSSGTMTVQVGSSAVLVGITVKGKGVFLAAPHVTPYTYSFMPSGGS